MVHVVVRQSAESEINVVCESFMVNWHQKQNIGLN